MSAYGGVDLTAPCWGIDTVIAGALTDAQLEAMLTTPLRDHSGNVLECPKALMGYVPLSGNKASGWDMNRSRLFAAMDMGWLVWLGQHCRSGSWTASTELGAADGSAAAEYADSIGYDASCHLAADDESVKNGAAPHFTSWCSKVQTPMLYTGFAPGMTPDELYALPDVSAYWGAYGPWNVSRRGVRVRQGLTVPHCGVQVDTDRIAPDNFGGVLRAMGKLS